MSTDRQLEQTISRWLEGEAPTQLSDRVLRATLERTRNTRQQSSWQALLRRLQVNRTFATLAGVAAVVVVAVIAVGLFFNQQGGIGGPRPTPTLAPSPTAAPSPTPAGLDVGEFLLYDGRRGGPRVTVTIPVSGWDGEAGLGLLTRNEGSVAPDGVGMIGPFAGDDVYVYGDPCQWRTTISDAAVTTVDEMVAALSNQASRDASEPVDISVDGHSGKLITLHVPDDAVFADCDGGEFRTLVDDPLVADSARHHQDPGQIDEVWIVDVDGELLVFFGSYYEGTPAEHVEEMRSMLGSMTFGD